MVVTLPERALLVKLFYESKGNAVAALREFRRLKNLRKGPLLPQVLKGMITRFEKTGHLGVQPGCSSAPAFFPVQNSSQSAVDGQRQGEATALCIGIPG
ncbi:DUF4817 domain-containing protein [Trichonephila clavipes]|uniref:DUF4817 domain-containing protein n=1 Tax=Trichonephila clavipes TaxID=2585209 RepID=A0A8X6VLV6_TRICX|nr:DUF4817 domain-containing protein [Trichonephila clavipes]